MIVMCGLSEESVRATAIDPLQLYFDLLRAFNSDIDYNNDFSRKNAVLLALDTAHCTVTTMKRRIW